jgi:hypothetical protein
MKQRDPNDASKKQKAANYETFKINFRILTLAFVQSPIKTFSLYLQINRLFAGFLREG